MWKVRFITLAATALALNACTRETPSERRAALEESVGAVAYDAVANPPSVHHEKIEAASVAASAAQINVAQGMLIRTGHARLEVDSVDAAVAAVRSLAARVNGSVTNVVMQAGQERIREATLTLRVPADRFDETLTALTPIGEVEAVNVSTDDVGEEYVDVETRLANGRRLEQRLLSLLESRTGKLEDVLAVERELARVREQIESLEGRLRYLRSRVSMSTLSVTMHEPGPLLAQYGGEHILGRALRQALRNFVNLVAGFIAALGVLVPVALTLWLGWILLRRYRRRARTNAAPALATALHD